MNSRVRFSVFARDNFTCIYCGRKPPDVALEVDHAISRSNNGSEHMENYVTACEECNRGKWSRNTTGDFDNWEDRLIHLVKRYDEYRDLANTIEQVRYTLKDEINQILKSNMPNYKVIDEKTGEIFNSGDKGMNVWMAGASIRGVNHIDCNIAKICSGKNEDGEMCCGFTGRGFCEYVYTGNKPKSCPLTIDEFIKLPDISTVGLLDTILIKNQYICNSCHAFIGMENKKTHNCQALVAI